MVVLSRRDFGKALLGAVPAMSVLRATRLGATPLSIGVTTSSFSDLPRLPGRDNVDAVLQAARGAGVTHIELALHNVEPAPPSTAPVMGGSAAYPRRVVLTPEEIAASDATARAALRTWRLQTAPAVFEDVRRRIASAGLAVDACAVTVNDSFTDDEIDAMFRQVKALGARTVSSPLTLATARRLVPFAERHDVAVSIHNQIDGHAAGLIDLPRVAQALALSPRFRLRLDVGRVTASNRDAVETARELLPRSSCVVLTDHLRNGGASQPLGEGDTPLAGVLQMLAAADPSMPVLLEYDYRGLRPSGEEVKTALAYLTSLRPRG